MRIFALLVVTGAFFVAVPVGANGVVKPKLTVVAVKDVDASGNMVMTFTGSSFVNGAWGSLKNEKEKKFTTKSISANALEVTVPVADFKDNGSTVFVVFNSDAAESDAQTFKLSKPSATGLTPWTSKFDADVTVEVNGSGFYKNSKVKVGTRECATTWVSATKLKCTVTKTDMKDGGTLKISVIHPFSDKPSSGTQDFTVIGNPKPYISTASIMSDDATNVRLVFNGGNFVDGVWGSIKDEPTKKFSAKFNASHQIEVTIPKADFKSTGLTMLVPVNPGPGGGAATTAYGVTVPVPGRPTLFPSQAEAGGADLVVKFQATGFLTDTVIRVNGQDRPTAYVNANTLNVTLTKADLAAPGTLKFTARQVFGEKFEGLPTDFKVTGNPKPKLTSIAKTPSPQDYYSFPSKKADDVVLRFTGADFISASIVSPEGSPETKYVTKLAASNVLDVAVPLDVFFKDGTLVEIKFIVTNPAPFGGVSESRPYTLAPATPTLSYDLSAYVGATSRTLTAQGGNFNKYAKVQVGGTDRPTTYVSTSQLKFDLTEEDVAKSGTLSYAVVIPGGPSSVAKKINVNNPGPKVTAHSPTKATRLAPDTVVTMTGTGFVKGVTRVRIGKGYAATSDIVTVDADVKSATELTVTVPAKAFETSSEVFLFVSNPAPGGGSAGDRRISVSAPAAKVTSTDPAKLIAGGPDATITLKGSGFYAGTSVNVGGTKRKAEIELVSDTELKVKLLAADYPSAAAGGLSISLTNDTLETTRNTSVTVPVENARPTLTSVDPAEVPNAVLKTVTLTGTGFIAGSTVKVGGVSRTVKTQTATTLTFDFSTTAAGPQEIVVTNPAPGGGDSGKLTIVVGKPKPALSGLNQSTVAIGAAVKNFTISGYNFLEDKTKTKKIDGKEYSRSATEVTVDGKEVEAYFVNATRLLFDLGADFTGKAGELVMKASNGDGLDSNELKLAVQYPAPTASVLSPKSKAQGDEAFTLTIEGAGFTAESKVLVGGKEREGKVPLLPGELISNRITVEMTKEDLAAVGSLAIAVSNPAPGGGTSSKLYLTVVRATPVLESIEPAETAAGKSVDIVLTGRFLGSISAVEFETLSGNFAGVSYTSRTETEVRATFAGSNIAYPRVVKVRVSGTDSGKYYFSNTVDLNVTAKPTLTSVVFEAFDKDGDVVLKFSGASYKDGAKAGRKDDKDKAYPTAYVDAATLKVTVPLDDFFRDGKLDNIPFKVTNPDGKESDAQPYKLVLPKLTLASLAPKTPPQSLTPNATVVRAADKGVAAKGTNFTKKSVVRVGGKDRVTTWKSSGELSFELTVEDVAKAGSLDVTVAGPDGVETPAVKLAVHNRGAHITSFEPNPWLTGADVSLQVTGLNFLPGQTILTVFGPNDAILFQVTIPADATETSFTVTIPADKLPKAGSETSIETSNPAPAESGSSQSVEIADPAAITALVPSLLHAGGLGAEVDVEGSGFLEGSIARVDGADRATTYVSGTRLKVAVTAEDIAKAGTLKIDVTGAFGGRAATNALDLTVKPAKPVAKEIKPTIIPGGDYSETDEVLGENFGADAWISLDYPTTTIDGPRQTVTFKAASASSTRVTFFYPGYARLIIGSKLYVRVFNASQPDALTEPLTVTVGYPKPSIKSITPASANVGGTAATNIVIDGADFYSKVSVVKANGTELPSTFVKSKQLKFSLPASYLASATDVMITVTNPEPGGGESNAAKFTVKNLRPTLTAISPDRKFAGDATFELTLTGTNFTEESVVKILAKDLKTTYVDGKTLKAEVDAADIKTVGSKGFTVANPEPGGGAGGLKILTVVNPLPKLEKLSVEKKTVGAAGFVMTLTGSGFNGYSAVRLDGVKRKATLVSGTELTVAMTADDLKAPGEIGFTVFNDEPEGGESEKKTLEILNPAPSLDTFAPFQADAGDPELEIVLTGKDFVPASVVLVDGKEIPTTYVDGQTLKAKIPASYLAKVGILAISVYTRAPGGGTSQALGFDVVAKPSVTLLTPGDGETLQGGAQYAITWKVEGATYENSRISLARDGEEFAIVTTGGGNSGSYLWTVPSNLNGPIALTIDIFQSGSASLSDTAEDLMFGAAPAPPPAPEPEPTPTPAPTPGGGGSGCPPEGCAPTVPTGTPPPGGGPTGPTGTPGQPGTPSGTPAPGPDIPSSPGGEPTPAGEKKLTPPARPEAAKYDYVPTEIFAQAEGDWIDWTQTLDTANPECGLRKTLYKKSRVDTVWYCGWDGKLHAFQNPKIYFSWYAGFGSVKVISDAILDALPKADPVQYRPAVRLVKTADSPRVYAVEKDWILRLIPDEATARDLYGPAWASYIDDMPTAFIGAYAFGPPVRLKGAP